MEVDDLGELLGQQGHEQLVQRDAEHGRLVGRLACIGRVINRRATHGKALYRQHGEALDLVVVAGMVAVRAFVRGLAGMDHAFQHDLRAGRHLQIAAQAFHELGARAAQQPRELVVAARIGHRCHGGEHRRRIGAERHGHREWGAGARELVITEVERAAAMREPAHDDAVSPDHLLAVDAEVVPLLLWTACDSEAPSDERPGVTGPAVLDRQAREIDVVSFAHALVAGRRRALLRRHVEQLLEEREFLPQVAQALGRLGLLQVREQLADFAQLARALDAHRRRNARDAAEEIGEHRDVMTGGPLEQQRRAAGAQHAIADLGHLEPRRDFRADAPELTLRFQLRKEFSQVRVAHRLRTITHATTRSLSASAKSSKRGSRPRIGYTRSTPASVSVSVVLPSQPSTPSAMPPSTTTRASNGSALAKASITRKKPCRARPTPCVPPAASSAAAPPANAASGVAMPSSRSAMRSEEHTSELQSRGHLVCRLLLEKKKTKIKHTIN